MTAPFDNARFEQVPIVAILRGFSVAQVRPIVEACRAGGLRNLEITMNSDQPESQIAAAIDAAEGTMNLGAGTVTNERELEAALQAGAGFIVTPTLNPKVMRTCTQANIPIFPGAYTPTEIVAAHDAGAHMVKVFPSNIVGPSFIKALRGPFPDIPLMPTGGINHTTIRDYLKAGARGFGVGSPILNAERIQAGDWGWLTEQVRAFCEIFENREATQA